MKFSHFLLNSFWCCLFALNHVNAQCWSSSYGRGVGKIPSSCADGHEKDASLCYKECKNGYNGVGPVCWEECDDGYTNTGAFCQRWAKTKNKGCCCVNFFGKKSCCNKCDAGYTDTGCTCYRGPRTHVKDTYGRGVGKPMVCDSDEDYDAGLCYKQCKNGYKGIGPVCWSKGCHGAYTYSCGGALCTQSSSDCAELLGGIGENVLFGVMDILTLVGSLGTNVAALASSYSDISAIGVALINDICANPNKLQTQCIRKIDNGKLQSCNSTGVNPVSCGLFCTSTKIVCAKTTIDLTSQIAGVLGLVGSAVPNKNAEKIASEISSKDLKKILDAIKLIDAATLDYQIFQTFVDLMSGSLGSGYC